MRLKIFLLMITATLMTAPGLYADELNPVLGKTADFVFREADLDRLLASQPAEIQKRFQDDPQLKLQLVRDLLVKKAVVALVRKNGFDKKPEIREQLSHLVDNFLAQEYLAKVVVGTVTIPEDDVKKYYQEHEKDFAVPEQIKLRHILFSATKETSAEAREKAKNSADAVLLRLRKGEDFAKLAQEFSDDQNSAQKGGDLGTISRGKTNSEEFENAAFSLKPGETSSIISTAYGFHIVRVDERIEKRTAGFSEVRDFIHKNLKDELEQKKAQDFLAKAAKDSGLEIFSEKITGIREEPAKSTEPVK